MIGESVEGIQAIVQEWKLLTSSFPAKDSLATQLLEPRHCHLIQWDTFGRNMYARYEEYGGNEAEKLMKPRI